MLVIVAYIIAVASFVGPSQAATPRRLPAASSRLMASPATTGSSTSRPSAMISVAMETCCRSMPQHVHHAEGHQQGERNRQRHQQRRAPLPEADQRHQDHQPHRLVQARHEQVDVLLHLPRLIAGARDDQVLRQAASQVVQRRVHLPGEIVDLLARAHLHRKRDGAGALPLCPLASRQE